MDRRLFLRSLVGAAVAAHTLDIEKLLWVPDAKRIFIPPFRADIPAMFGIGDFGPGDVITIAGNYGFNPITRRPTEHLQRFLVMADFSLRPFTPLGFKNLH